MYHLQARCTVSPVIFAVNQQMCDVFTTLFSEWARHQSRDPISPATPSASANIPPIVAADSTPSRTPVTESHVSLYVHLEELAVKLEGANQCVTTCAVQHVTARVSVDHDARQAEVHTRVRAGVETIQITAQQRHAEELDLARSSQSRDCSRQTRRSRDRARATDSDGRAPITECAAR
jgi:hypothetical protein